MANRDIGKFEDKTSCPSFVVVCDGKINHEGLQLCEKDERFIEKKLKSDKIDMKKVLVMICDKNGKYSVVEKE